MQFFLLRVAVRLGFPSVRHLLDRYDITSPELNDLMALERLDPPLGVRSDHHLAVLSTVVANSRMGAKKSYKPEDFWPKWGTKRPMSKEEILNVFRALG